MRKFEITILGSNSALPDYDRFSSAHLLNANETLFLIDCGEGTQIQLRRFAIKYFKIQNIFISHLHGDHFFGLFGLLASYNLLHRTTPLNIYAPQAAKNIIETVRSASFGEEYSFELNFFPLKEKKEIIFENKDITVYAFPLIHRVPTWGFLFEEKKTPLKIIKEKLQKYNLTIEQIKALKRGEDILLPDGKLLKNKEMTLPPPPMRKYAYISDTAYSQEIIPYIKNADLIYHETTFLKNQKELARKTFHSTTEDAAIIAKLANAKRLLIGHFSQRNPVNKYLTEVKEIFPNTIPAKDGLKIQI